MGAALKQAATHLNLHHCYPVKAKSSSTVICRVSVPGSHPWILPRSSLDSISSPTCYSQPKAIIKTLNPARHVMLEWKLLCGDKEDGDDLSLGLCRQNDKFIMINAGSHRVFHRVNLSHLLTMQSSQWSPAHLPLDYAEECGVEMEYYLQLFPHRMIHMGNLEMTCYMNNPDSVIFSFSVDTLEKNCPDIRYIDQNNYLAYCGQMFRDWAAKGDTIYQDIIENPEKEVFKYDQYSMQDKRTCEVILPMIDFAWADQIIIPEPNTLSPLTKWCQSVGLSDAPILNLDTPHQIKHLDDKNKRQGLCDPAQCEKLYTCMFPFWEEAADTCKFDLIHAPKECPFKPFFGSFDLEENFQKLKTEQEQMDSP